VLWFKLMSVATFPFTRDASLLLNAVALACYCILATYSKADATQCYHVVSEFSCEICGWNIGREIGYIREAFCYTSQSFQIR